MPKNSQIAALAVGAAAATLLAAAQEMFPGLKSVLPLNQSSFVQSSALILGALAVSIIYDVFRHPSSKADQEDDPDAPEADNDHTDDDTPTLL